MIELVVVLAIISLFAGIVVPTLMNFRSRRGKDVGHAALLLRATIRAARTYAIQNRVPARVFCEDGRRYGVEYYEDETGKWEQPLGNFARETVLPAHISMEPNVFEHIFDPTGTLDDPSAIKAVITLNDEYGEVSDVRIEILRATGRVRIRS